MSWEQVLGLWVGIPGVLGSIVLGACTGGSATDEEHIIRELDAAWSRALGAKDLDAVMTYYADDAVFLAPNAPILKGKDDIRARFARRVLLPGYSVSFAPTTIVVAKSRDMAYEIGTYRLTVGDSTGGLTTTTGKHLVAWEKREGTWKVTAESINSDHPPATPAAPSSGT